jgi:hypothetical protein
MVDSCAEVTDLMIKYTPNRTSRHMACCDQMASDDIWHAVDAGNEQLAGAVAFSPQVIHDGAVLLGKRRSEHTSASA